jgi:uncharacterized protein YndB with AHSA1/START domain
MKFTNTITIDRSPADVFAYLSRFENVPRWNEAIVQTRRTSQGPVRVGSTYVQTRSQPSPGEDSFEVTEYEPDRKLAIRGTFGSFTGSFSYQLESIANGTRLTNTVDLDPPVLMRIAGPFGTSRLKSAVAKNLGRLKEIIEGS